MNGVYRWAKVKAEQEKPIPLIFVENVTDLRLWSGLEDWYTHMEMLGYQHHTLSFNSRFAHPFPAPVPQSRDRCYIVLWQHHLPAPNLDLRPAASCLRCQQEIGAVQCWRGLERRFGDYGVQYEYHCPQRDTPLVPYYTAVERVIDWSIPITKVGERRRPLCQKTLANIRKGLCWYLRQPLHEAEHRAFLMSYYGNAVFRCLSDVAGTVTTRDRHCLITLPEDWSSGDIPDVLSCGYRMCVLSEYQGMMGLPPKFGFACSKTTALKQLGLAVTPAAALEVLIWGLGALGYTIPLLKRSNL
jgi:DNA (cytosine-5)-methyltransferase 1